MTDEARLPETPRVVRLPREPESGGRRMTGDPCLLAVPVDATFIEPELPARRVPVASLGLEVAQ
ncbi:hypothetical protein GCM10010345_04880 [Streptomyces canarius]|uniref:Uncharacterized protein n=1 Tax=Streptomyces canarius TaxID=285453 RepID=A0ABQ3CGY0_9ACTN|nr:hypothetical protein GCM10010345_04880 [Streptomyces canarius]